MQMIMQRIINKISIFVLAFILLPSVISANEAWNKAQKLYADKEYSQAAEIYSGLLKEGESAALYYNYGNALYKSGKIAPAILAYERALKLNPSMQNARYNLRLANQHIVDKIEPVQHVFIHNWIVAIEHLFSSNQWAYLGIALFIVFLAGVLLYLFSGWLWLRKIAFYGGIIALVLSMVSISYAFTNKNQTLNSPEAIVMIGSVSLKSSPDNSGTEVFVLHEGTKVNIENSVGDWDEVQIADGNVGWLPKKVIEEI